MVLLTINARCLEMLIRETCLKIVTNLLHGSSRIKTPVTEFLKCGLIQWTEKGYGYQEGQLRGKCAQVFKSADTVANQFHPYLEHSHVADFNSLRPRQNGRHFAEDIFKCIFLNENILIPIKISLKFVP